jgi:hypothetical protein
MPSAAARIENSQLLVEVDPADLAAHVTFKPTGETFRMAAAQPDDVRLDAAGGGTWESFGGKVASLTPVGGQSLEARLPSLALAVTIRLDEADVVFEVAPAGIDGLRGPRDVLYPRHFLLPEGPDSYATFPFGAGAIIPTRWEGRFHHREGYAEAVANWIGGYTGRTGYCAIAETPHDLLQAVHHEPGQPAGVFFHWLGSLGKLAYARRVRYHFEEGLDYVRQAKCYREYTRRIGWFRSMEEKAEENPNVRKLIGAPIVPIGICHRFERTMKINLRKFSEAAEIIEKFRADTGIEQAVVHVDGWGYWGYDAMHPDVIPPMMDAGGRKGLAEMARRVKDLGYLFGLHDQYIDYYFHAPSFDQRWSIVTEDGNPVRINRWCGGPCGHLCYTRIPRYVRRNYYEGVHKHYPLNHNSPSIWEMAAPTASYLDCFCRGGVECWSKDHPMTRAEGRRIQNEIFQIVRNGSGGQMVVLSCEHPRDYSLPYLDFGWSIGHLAFDVPNVTGEMVTEPIGQAVPLWHLAFHDALCLPHGGDPLTGLLYAQAPYLWPSHPQRGQITQRELEVKKVLLDLHRDAAFSEMTGHEMLSADGSVQKCTYDGGLEVEVNRAEGTYRISDGRAKTAQWRPLVEKEK